MRGVFFCGKIATNMSASFFTSHLDQWVMRTDVGDSKARTFYIPNNHKWVEYLHGLQESGTKFAPIIKIHKAGDSTCVSCEG